MKEQTTKLKSLIASSRKILITSHISPDPDALCSVLLAGTILKLNYPNKHIVMNMEELTGELNFLSGYERITQKPLIQAVDEAEPELIIIVDAMNFSRCTRGDVETVRQRVKTLNAKLAIIDHHEPEGIEDNQVYINNHSPACAQDCYEIFVKTHEKLPDGYAQTAMLGIISDTNRFMYDNPRHKATFDVVDELIDAGASIEKIVNLGSRYSVDDMRVMGELAKNLQVTPEYTYTFIGDDFMDEWVSKDKKADELKLGAGYFVNEFIRNINGNQWGFMVYRDIAVKEPVYSVSFRAVSGIKDISLLAKALGGGGHKAAAGAKFQATSTQDALEKVKAAIASQNLDS